MYSVYYTGIQGEASMSIVASAAAVSAVPLVATGFSVDAGLWLGVAVLASSAAPRPGRSIAVAVTAFAGAILLTSLALVAA